MSDKLREWSRNCSSDVVRHIENGVAGTFLGLGIRKISGGCAVPAGSAN